MKTKRNTGANIIKIKTLILAGLFGAAMASQGAVVTQPTGLNPGDQYRLVFITSTTRDAASTDIADYNAFVNTAAALNSDLDGISWTAIGSTATVDARDNTSTTGTGVPIYLLNDTAIADDYADLWDGSIDNILDRDESGGEQYNKVVWTGTTSAGVKDGSLALGTGGEVTFGKSNLATGSWIDRNITDPETDLNNQGRDIDRHRRLQRIRKQRRCPQSRPGRYNMDRNRVYSYKQCYR